MTIEEMKKRKKELGYTNEQISELSGVPLGTVQKIFAGVTQSPRYDTLQALHRILDTPTMVMEAKASYGKKSGEYTTEDYYALPPERRTELISGVFYDMASPTSVHQMIATEIWQSLKNYIRSRNGDCIPFVAPIDVCLNCDEKTMVQPDVMVVCDREKIMNQCIFGAPDLVVEILSNSTWKKDMYLKLERYAAAGVREYWIVDPEKEKVIVYDLSGEGFPMIYGFDSCIPVGIFSGNCKIDFQEIRDYIRFIYEKDS